MPQRFQWFMKQIIFNISAVWSPLPARCKLSCRIDLSKGVSHDIKWSSSWYYPYLLWSRTVPVGDDSACMRWASITSTGYLSLSPRWMISFDTKTVGILNNVKFMKLQRFFTSVTKFVQISSTNCMKSTRMKSLKWTYARSVTRILNLYYSNQSSIKVPI